MEKINIFDLNLNEFQSRLKRLKIESYVATQVFEWIYKKRCLKLSKFTNISKKNRQVLDEKFSFSCLKLVKIIRGEKNRAIKMLLQTEDNKSLEAVILDEKKYYTLCVSSQCGCPLGCKFCLTGVVGLKRQLKSNEIIEQVIQAEQQGFSIKNIVFMGMGEPLLNYKAVMTSIDTLCDKNLFGMSKRGITVSTAGYLPGIQKLMTENRALNIALSVGSVDPLKRKQLMPIESRFSLNKVSKILWTYLKDHNRKLTLEYTILKDVNHSELELKLLSNLAKYLNAKVNLINLNPHPKIPFEPVSINFLKLCQQKIKNENVAVTIRYEKGQEITAACGQLGESLLS